MEVFLVVLYFLTYDNADMRPEEEINFPSIVEQLTDPEIVTRNIIANLVITAGTTVAVTVFMAVPTLFWTGEPMRDPLADNKDSNVYFEDVEHHYDGQHHPYRYKRETSPKVPHVLLKRGLE